MIYCGMIISFMGGESLKVQFGDIVIAYNPISKNSKLKATSFGSDIVLTSLDHEDMNGVENASRGDKAPFAISGPGEYEVKGVYVKGYPSESNYGGKTRLNTIYTVALEGMNLCFLGALSNTQLPHDIAEDLEDVDILFVPIGGEGVLSAAEAQKISVQIEPRIIVPIHYGSLGAEGALKNFIKEAGGEAPETLDKLTIKKKDLEGKEGEIVVLNPTS